MMQLSESERARALQGEKNSTRKSTRGRKEQIAGGGRVVSRLAWPLLRNNDKEKWG